MDNPSRASLSLAVIAEVARQLQKPIIAGGMVSAEADWFAAMHAGAIAVSTGSQHLWHIDLDLPEPCWMVIRRLASQSLRNAAAPQG